MLNAEVLIASHKKDRSLEILLENMGYLSTTISSGDAVLQYLRDHTPKLMILDADLPIVSGTSVAYRAKKHSRLKAIPSIVLVDVHDERLRAQAAMSRADRVMLTPVASIGIKETVSDLLAAQSVTPIWDALLIDTLPAAA